VLRRLACNTNYSSLKERYSALRISSFNAKYCSTIASHVDLSLTPEIPLHASGARYKVPSSNPLASCTLLMILATKAIAILYGFFGAHRLELNPLSQPTYLHPFLPRSLVSNNAVLAAALNCTCGHYLRPSRGKRVRTFIVYEVQAGI
jgi:hypothetical protein